MKTKRLVIVTASLILSFSVFYIAYRVYHAQQLNLRLESFMAEQIVQIQDKWFETHGESKQNEYYIYRDALFYIHLGKATIDGKYLSFWFSHDGNHQQLLMEEWYKELAKDTNEKLTWKYSIQPLSDSIICIQLDAYKPTKWEGNFVESIPWTVDTSKAVWQLEPYDTLCPTHINLLNLTLVSVH